MFDEFWLWVIALVIAVVILFGVPFNIKKSIGTNKKVVIIGNALLVGVIAFVLLFGFADNMIRSPYIRDYNSASGGFFKTIKYTGTIEGYYTFSYNKWLETVDIAVPVDQCDIPALTHIYPNVIVYYDAQRPIYNPKKQITLDGGEFYESTSVAAVFTDYSDIIIIIVLIDVPILFLFNLTELIIVTVGMKKEILRENKDEVQN